MIYLLPYSYGFRTRAKTPWDKLSLFLIFPLPVWLLCGSYPLTFAGKFTVLYSVYELGYLYNDYITVRHEKKPHVRLAAPEYERVKGLLAWIVLSRGIFAIGLLWATGAAPREILALLVMAGAFWLHNVIRSRWNIATYFLLCAAKYGAAVCLGGGSARITASFIAAFVLPRTLEHAAKSKYDIVFLQGLEPHGFRFRYFGALSLAATVLFFGSPLHLLSLWYFAYRAAVYAYIKKRAHTHALS